MLKKKTAIIVLSIVMALSLVLGLGLAHVFATDSTGGGRLLGNSAADTSASAAITAATSFNTLTNGSKWYYTNTNGTTGTVTVNTSQARGSVYNPYVIHTTAQWVYFTNLITANDATYNKAGVYYYIDADLDFANNTIQPVGVNTTGFLGYLFGGKHSIKRATLASVVKPDNSAQKVMGLFYYLASGSQLFDLTIDASCTFNYAPGVYSYSGTFAALATNPYFVACASYANLTVDNGALTVNNIGYCAGGFLGWAASSTSYNAKFYYCVYKGTLTLKAFSTSLETSGDNIHLNGGFIGAYNGNFVVDTCSVDVTINYQGGGLNTGGLFGGYYNRTGLTGSIVNSYISCVRNHTGGVANTPDYGTVAIQTGGTSATLTSTNVYVWGYRDGGAQASQLAGSTQTGCYNATSKADLNTKAAANSTLASKFNVQSDGTLIPKGTAGTFAITYNLRYGSWSTQSSAPTSYTSGWANQTITAGVSTAPTRTGYVFKGWSLSPTATTGTTGNYVIPAAQSGTLTVYATWQATQAFTGTAPTASPSIVYGADYTFTAANVTHAAGVAANTGVTFTYEWLTSANASTGVTASTYKLTKPAASSSTVVHTYKVKVTATPKDGISTGYTQTYTMTLTVQKQGVAIPTATTGLIYNGQVQTGVSSSSTLLTLSEQTTGTKAGSYTAKATLKDTTNYCWGSNGGTDSNPKNIGWSIGRQGVAAPTISNNNLTYNGANQKPTVSTNSLYSYTNNGATNYGNYTVTVALNDKTNYCWGSNGGTDTNDKTLNWSIAKANITLGAPSYTNDSVDGRNYVGQTIAALTITQSTGSHVRAGSSAVVAGTWSWTAAATTKLAATQSLNVTFTPSDTTNYNSANINITVTAVQLQLLVRELQIECLDANGLAVNFDSYQLKKDNLLHTAANLELARSIVSTRRVVAAPVAINVDYATQFAVDSLKISSRGTQVNGTALNWKLPVGYSLAVYSGVDSSNNGTGKFNDNAKTDAITANLTVYLGYIANDVNYTVITVKQALVNYGTTGLGDTPTKSDAIQHVDGLKIIQSDDVKNCISTSTLTAKAGTKVNFPATTVEGFTRRTQLDPEGTETPLYASDDQAKYVLGTGDTVLITYYERNSYLVTWNYNGADYYTNGLEDTAHFIKNKYTYRLNYGEEFKYLNTDNLVYQGYEFDAWYNDSACIERASLPQPQGNDSVARMPAFNITVYAGKAAKTYTLRFRYDLGNIEGLPDDYKASSAYDSYSDDNPYKYTVEQIINSGVIRLATPVMNGFKFAGWVYFDNDNINGTPHSIATVTRTNAANYVLHATWTAVTYTITLNSNGGNKVTPSSIKMDNLQYFDGRITGSDNTAIIATRAGYEFQGWARKVGDEYITIYDGDTYNTRTYGTILYAMWDAKPVQIVYHQDVETDKIADISIKSSTYENGTEAFTPEDTQNPVTYLVKDSVLTIDITPANGYQISSIVISGISFTNHGRFTVRTYDDDTMVIKIEFEKKRYNITYMFNGGTYVGTAQYARSFVIDDTIDLIGGSLISKLGYKFMGWGLNGPDNENVGNFDQDISEVFTNDFEAQNTVLYAKWAAAEVKMVYRNNYIGLNADGSPTTTEVVEEVERDDIVTGATIVLWKPEGPFVPNNRELIGWATQPNGDIAYNINYKYIQNGNESQFEAQDTFYTVQANAANVNTLYAVWRVTNVQYVTFEAEHNNTTYRDEDSYTGVTLTARPRHAYQAGDNLSLVFKWYKVDPSWPKWTEDDLAGLKDDELNQAQSNIGMYKIPANAVALRISPVLSGNDITGDRQFDVYGGGINNTFIKNVKDAGLYICSLTATGKYFSSSGGLKTSTITMYGQYEVIINKADLPQITLDNDLAVYNGKEQSLTVGTPQVSGNVWSVNPATGAYRLPDGSQLKVNYVYTNDETGDSVNGGVKNVGFYRASATFEFIGDNGNYNVPDELNAEFEIVPFEITDVDWRIETQLDGVWSQVPNNKFEDNVYTRNPFRIVATPKNIVSGDDIQITMFYDGEMDDHESAPANVGNYIAYCDTLTGSSRDNYILSPSLNGKEFNIIKADHNVSFSFKDVTRTYDGTFLNMTTDGRLSITENGNAVELEYARRNQDTITLADGCTIELNYTIDITSMDARYDVKTESNRGGTDAGIYVITVAFVDSEDNQLNFNALEDISATLTVSQAVYSKDGKRPGLSDDQLNRYVTENGNVLLGEDNLPVPNLNGFGDNHSIDFDPNKVYLPVLNVSPSEFATPVKYKYEYAANSNERFVEFQFGDTDKFVTVDNKTGLNKSGLYRITASLVYSDLKLANNYATVSDQVVELKIMPGIIDRVEVDFTQADYEKDILRTSIVYGDTFDFYDYTVVGGEGRYWAQIRVYYRRATGELIDGYEVVDNYQAKFLNENGVDAFTFFDRATVKTVDGQEVAIKQSATPSDDDVYYKVKVSVYGETGDLKIKVKQKALGYDNIGFDTTYDESHDTSVQLSNGKWSFGFTYNGKAGAPGLDNDNNAYNFVGISTDTLTGSTNASSQADILAIYEYTEDDTVTPTTDNWQTMPAGGLTNAGVYNIRVRFVNRNNNYAPLNESRTTLNCKINILPKVLSGSDIIWQYSTTGNEADYVTLKENANLTYRGTGGYHVRALFRNLAVDEDSSNPYFAVEQIQLQGTSTQSKVVEVVNAGSYTVEIIKLQDNGNYQKPSDLQANIVIDPYKVNLNWSLVTDDENATALTYNGKDQLKSGIKVTYDTGKDHGLSGGDNQGQNPKVTLAVEGNSFVNVGTYALTATLTDTNYVPSNATYYASIDKFVVDEENTAISWYYINSAHESVKIESAAIALDYIGADITVYFTYAVQGDDSGTGVTDNRRTAYVMDRETGANVCDAGNYTLTAKPEENSNYDLSNVIHNLTVNKASITVTWQETNEYTYNGESVTVKAGVTGQIGKDAAKTASDILAYAGETQRNAGEYSTFAVLANEFAVNYAISGAAADGSVHFDWKINKLPVAIQWQTDGLVYNNGETLTDWSAQVTNLQPGDEKVDFTYEIYSGEDIIPAMKLAGNYTVKVVEVSDSNYSIADVADHTVTVAKATPVLDGVVYTEYSAINTSYQGNIHGLRNDKLQYSCSYQDVAVKGTLTFDPGVSLDQGGITRPFPLTFTPEDKDNYNSVKHTLRIKIEKDSVVRLGFDNNSLATIYAVNSPFNTMFVKVFFEYASYYEEIVNNEIVSYGYRVAANSSNNISFSYNNRGFINYTFKDTDVGEDRVITVAARLDGENYYGEIHITVTDAFPTKLTILNKEELQKLTYYVGNTFDKSIVKFYVEYEDELSNGEISYTNIDIANPVLPDVSGPYDIKFTYFTNTEHEKSDTLRIYVSNKESVRVAIANTTIKWLNDNPIDLPAIVCEDGSALPDGISYTCSITDTSGRKVALAAQGDYLLNVKFTVDTSKYNSIEDLNVTLTVKDIKAIIDTSLLDVPDAARTYNGNALTAADYTLKNIHIVDNDNSGSEYKYYTVNYTINGKPAADVEVLEARTYKIVANITVKSDDDVEFSIEPYTYEIVINKAVNVINEFVINNWIEGNPQGLVTFSSTFGTPDYTIYRLNDNGQRDTLGSALPTTRGKYVAVATVHGTVSYDEVYKEAYFTVTKPMLNPAADISGESLRDDNGKDIIQVTSSKGIDPFYNLQVKVLEEEDISNISIKKQVVLGGYDIKVVDSTNTVVDNPGEYTVRLLLSAEQRNSKNLKVYTVDEYGAYTEISGANVDDNGYLVFKTNNFKGSFVVGARDGAAIANLGWIIGISVGAVVAVAAIVALVVVVIKKKKEND